MHVLGIATADDVDPDPVVGPLLDRLEDRGSVGVVRRGDVEASRTTYELGDGGWSAEGVDLGLHGALDRLSRDHDYAVVVGYPEARIDTLVVGDVDARNPLLTVDSAADVDPEAVGDALDGVEPYETLASLVAAAKRSPDAEYSGAIATFTGRVRALEDDEDSYTESLTFEKYEGVAAERLAAIREELEARDGVHEVLFHHRTGLIEYGEDIVFVVVLAGHREEAFRTVKDGIDRLKDEVPIFKKEVTVDEEFWVHERA